MTGNEMISFVQNHLLRDNKTFDAALILEGLNYAKSMLHTFMKRWCNADNESWKTNCTIPMVSGQREYTLPNGTLYSSAKKCSGKVEFLKSSDSNDTISVVGEFIDFHHNDDTTSDAITHIQIVHNSLWVYPLPNTAFNTTLYYSFIPDDIVRSDDEYTDWIEGYELMIAYQYCLIAKTGTRQSLEEIAVQLQSMKGDFVKESGRRIIGRPNTGANSRSYDAPYEIS